MEPIEVLAVDPIVEQYAELGVRKQRLHVAYLSHWN
jgi:hypothetical protein